MSGENRDVVKDLHVEDTNQEREAYLNRNKYEDVIIYGNRLQPIADAAQNAIDDTVYSTEDREVAYGIYVVMSTCIAIRKLPEAQSIDDIALESVYSLFSSIRKILKSHGRDSRIVGNMTISMLNVGIIPFIMKWNRNENWLEFKPANDRARFRKELKVLQKALRKQCSVFRKISHSQNDSARYK